MKSAPRDFCWANGINPKSLREGMVTVGVAVGPWAGAAEASPAGDAVNVPIVSKLLSGSVTFGRRQDDSKGHYRYRVTENADKCQMRLVGIDRTGRVFQATEWPGTVKVSASEVSRESTFEFDAKKIPLTQIKTVRLEVRPFRYVTFEDVALYPTGGAQ